MNLTDAKGIAEKYVSILAPFCHRIEIAGSIRREHKEVKDIEIVCIRKNPTLPQFVEAVNALFRVKGQPTGKYTQRLLPEGIKLDLFMCQEDNWGLIYAIRTGSAAYSHKVLATGWVKAGFKSIAGHLVKNGAIEPVWEEETLFDIIGVPWIAPQERET